MDFFSLKESASVSTSSNSNVVSSIQDNKVPYTFLIMFLVQFFLMIVDRAFYLRKNVRGKFIFQLLQVVFVHIWMFFALPFITKL
jgi:piezo-type mechanosensitive ion channel component 1/2